MFFK
jgi:hypothetical protein